MRNNQGSDLYEKYTYEIDGRFGNFKWLNNEFELEEENKKNKLSKLCIDIEYVPLVLTILRINTFFRTNKKSMVSFFSTDQENNTPEIIYENFFNYAVSESSDGVFLYLKKIENGLIEHHVVFTVQNYGNFFDIVVQTDEKSIKSFYKNLLNETNNFRLAVLPNIIQRITPYYEKILEKIGIVSYEDILNVNDDFFSLFDIFPEHVIGYMEAKNDFENFLDYLSSLKDQESSDFYPFENMNKDPEIDIDFTIGNMEELEEEIRDSIYEENNDMQEINKDSFYNEYNDLLIEMEEEFMNFMDHIMYDELNGQDKKKYLKGIKNIIDELGSLFNDLKSKKEFEKELLLDLVNGYGIEQVENKKDVLSEIFQYLNLDKDLKDIYEISEDKLLKDYKSWYKEIIFKKSKNMKEFIKN